MGISAAPSLRSLPAPRRQGERSLETCLAQRRSVRGYTPEPIGESRLGQLLWAVQGIADEGRRTVPSAGGLGGLEAYVADERGIWRYAPAQHSLTLERTGDLRQALSCAAGGQEFIGEAPVTIVLIGVQARIEARYGRQRGARYVLLEAGHAAQNLLLQATAFDLGAVPVGAFDDAEVRRLLNLSGGHSPLYLIPIGKPVAS